MATGLRAAALAQPTGLRAAALAPVPAAPAAAPQGQAFGNPMFGRTAIGQVARTVGDAAKFGSRLGLPTGDFAQRAYNVADGVEPVPETGVAADVVRGVASLPTAMLAIPAMGEQAAQAAEKQGASPNAALAIGTGVGIASGALEMVVPAMLAKTVTKGAATGLRALAMGALKTAGVEGATEGTQQVLQNVIPAIGESDPSRLTEGVAYNAGIGALVGGGAGGAATGVAQPVTGRESLDIAPRIARMGNTGGATRMVTLGQGGDFSPAGTPNPILPPRDDEPPEMRPVAATPEAEQAALAAPTESPAQAPVGPTAGTPDARPGVRSDIAPSNPWTTPLIDRVEGQGGPGREIGTRARLASDAAGALRGRWQLATKPIRTSLRGFSFRGPSETLSQRRTRKELNQSRDVAAQDTSGPLASYEFAKFQEAVESDEALATLTPQAQRAVKSFRDFVMQTGEDVAAVSTPEGGPILMQTEEGLLPFRGAEGGRRLIRQWTPELHEVMRAGDSSPAYRALAQALGEANGLDGDAALARLNGIRQQIVEKKSAVEIARTFKNFPSAIRLRNGVRVPLLQTDPMHAATSIVESLSKRVGYIQQFGQGNEGKSLGERLREDFVRQGGEQTDVDNLIRSLQGMPVDQPLTTARPGTWAGEGLRVADTATQVGNAALLTRSFVPNIFESASKTPVVGGIKRSLKGYGQMARMAVDPTFRKDLMTDIERRGWHTIDVLDWMLTPGRKMESAGKIAGNFLTGPAHTVNEMNDVHAALTARSMVNDLAAGKGTGMDRTRLELLQFTPQQIDTVMAGNPTPETQPLFDAVGRRVVSYSQGSTSMPAELSRLGNSNKYKRVVAFDRYAQFTADRLFRQIRAIADAKTPAQAGKHAALLGQSVVGHTIAGSGAVLLGSLLKDGIVGLADTVRHATAGDDEKEKLQSFATFLADAGQYAMMGGAADTIYRASESGSSADFAKTLVSGTIPGRYTLDFVDWYNGQGRYKNKSGVDNALAFAERNLPIWPVVGQAVSEIGLGKTDIRREVAIRRAWEFIRNNEGVGSGGVPADPIDKEAQAKSQAFGVAMKKLETALRDGNMADVPKLRGEVLKAGRESGKGPRASLYGKRIIPQINEKNRPAARKWMGEKNWQALEKYDALLTRYAETLPKGTP